MLARSVMSVMKTSTLITWSGRPPAWRRQVSIHLERDLELADSVRRDGAIRPDPDHAREVDEVTRLHDVAVVADGCSLPGTMKRSMGMMLFSHSDRPILTGPF